MTICTWLQPFLNNMNVNKWSDVTSHHGRGAQSFASGSFKFESLAHCIWFTESCTLDNIPELKKYPTY